MTISKMQNCIKKMQNNIKILFFCLLFLCKWDNIWKRLYFFKKLPQNDKAIKKQCTKNAILFPLPVDMIDFSSITVSVSVQKNTP